MAEEHLSPEEERKILELFEKSALADYPNPDRIGCPGTAFLQRLAFDRRSIPLNHPGIDHVPQCSPCFAEFVKFRNQARRRRRLLLLSAIAASLGLVAIAAWYALRVRQAPAPQVVARNPVDAFEEFHINLQNRSVPRGEQAPSGSSLKVPRQQLRLSIDLPIGSEPGIYETQILATPDAPLIQASGTATIEDGATVLRIKADLRAVPPGRYFLGFRRPPWDWTYIPIVLE